MAEFTGHSGMTRTLPSWRPLVRCAAPTALIGDCSQVAELGGDTCYFHTKVRAGLFNAPAPKHRRGYVRPHAPHPKTCYRDPFLTLGGALEYIAASPRAGELHTYKCSWHEGPAWHVTTKRRSQSAAA